MPHRKQLLLYVLLLFITSSATADLEEVIVSAKKRPQNIDEVAISMEVVRGSYLERGNYNTLEDLTANVPSVYVAKNSGATKLFMRGVGSQGNAGMDQAVSTYVDEIYHGRSRTTKIALVDVERIEILRGPQAVYFGKNSSAGAISIHTRTADLTNSDGYLISNVGTDGQMEGTIVYNQPLSDELAIRSVASVESLDGYWDMVDPQSGAKLGRGGGVDSRLFRITSFWQPDKRLSGNLKLEVQNLERNNPFAWQPKGCNNLYALGLKTQSELDNFWTSTGSTDTNPLKIPFSCQSGFVDFNFDNRSPAQPHNSSNFDSLETVIDVEWQFGAATLTSTTGFFEMDYLFEGNDLSHGDSINRILWSGDDSNQLSEELRLSSSDAGSLDWVLGVYWHSGETDYQIADADGRNPQNPQYSHSIVHQNETAQSVFGELTWRAWEHFRATLGLRWTKTDKTFSGIDTFIRSNILPMDQRAGFVSQLIADVNGDPANYADFARDVRNEFSNEKRSFAKTLPTVELAYKNNDSGLLYYKWSKGFKTGGFNFRLNRLAAEDLTYGSESVGAHEIGYKGVFLDNRLRLGTALFMATYRDLQQNSSRGDDGAVAAAVIRNVAKATSKGVEIEASLQLSAKVRLDLSSVVLDAQFDNYQGADCTRLQSVVSRTDVASNFSAFRVGNRCFQDLSGARMSFAPKWVSRAGLDYRYPLAGSLRLRTSLEWFYSHAFFTSPHADPLRQQDAFHKFNASIELADRLDRWTVGLIVNNVGNELTARQLGQDGDAAVSGLVDPPRRIFLHALFRF